MRKRIGFDLRCLPSDGSSGAGIPHAARELWEACIEACPPELELIAFVPGKAELSSGTIIGLPDARSRSLREALNVHPIDLLFCPSGTVPFGLSVPAIPWIHDLAIFSHPEWFPEPWWQRWLTTSLVRRGLRRARTVLAVSEATKQEIVTTANIAPDRIVVTGQGITLPPFAGKLPSELQEATYALVLGTVEPRKNIRFLQALWPEITKTSSEERLLVVAGRDGWGDHLSFSDPQTIRLSKIDESERLALLKQASVVLLPSLSEGFGRVAAEALHLGIPVIASDRGALPEVVSSYGQCLPLDSDRWIKAIKDTMKPGPIRQYWCEQAMAAKEVFSWSPVAATVLANLREN